MWFGVSFRLVGFGSHKSRCRKVLENLRVKERRKTEHTSGEATGSCWRNHICSCDVDWSGEALCFNVRSLLGIGIAIDLRRSQVLSSMCCLG